MKIHQNTVAYFKKMAAAAKTMLERNYWNRRKSGAEDLERQLAARAKAAAQLKQREDNLNAFKNLAAPTIRIKSMYPNGCIVSWDKPDGWTPDTYVVLAKDYGQKEWRSVASSNINWETRSQVLTNSYLAWGQPAERYEIAVAAVKNGVGRKESKTMIYPPETAKPNIKEIKIEPMKAGADSVATAMQPKPDPFAARHPGPAETAAPAVGVFESRAQEIQFYLRNYAGRRTRTGRPFIGDFRKHCKLYPRVGYKEMRRLWKQLDTAPTGD